MGVENLLTVSYCKCVEAHWHQRYAFPACKDAEKKHCYCSCCCPSPESGCCKPRSGQSAGHSTSSRGNEMPGQSIARERSIGQHIVDVCLSESGQLPFASAEACECQRGASCYSCSCVENIAHLKLEAFQKTSDVKRLPQADKSAKHRLPAVNIPLGLFFGIRTNSPRPHASGSCSRSGSWALQRRRLSPASEVRVLCACRMGS